MPRFHPVRIPGGPPASEWTIEQITPGEKPVPIDFYGRKYEVEAEISRLNAGGEVRRRVPSRVGQSKRVRVKKALSGNPA
jgi:hypothetical protein